MVCIEILKHEYLKDDNLSEPGFGLKGQYVCKLISLLYFKVPETNHRNYISNTGLFLYLKGRVNEVP